MLFPRGDGPLLSVLLPTRGRFNSLIKTIRSLIDNSRPESTEILLKIDTDDQDTINNLPNLPIANIKILIGDRGNGYKSMHIFSNKLAEIATGDWLMILNDDARMLTVDWDKILESIDTSDDFGGCQDVCMLHPGSPLRDGISDFPIIRRKHIEIVGHYALQTHVDSYLHDVYNRLPKANLSLSQIKISHGQEPLNDQTQHEVTQCQRTSSPDFYSQECENNRIKDSEKLLAHLQTRRDP